MNIIRALLVATFCCAGMGAVAGEFNARVLFAKDGDDIIVEYGDIRLDVRLLIVDAPEIRGDQPWGVKAKEALHALTAGEFVNVWYEKKSFGRFLGIVTLSDGRNVNEFMIRQGHAWAYCGSDGNPGRVWQAEAKFENLGLWALEKTPIDPCDWRDGERHQGS